MYQKNKDSELHLASAMTCTCSRFATCNSVLAPDTIEPSLKPRNAKGKWGACSSHLLQAHNMDAKLM
eukprot:6349343-Amphidinium_carterae.2